METASRKRFPVNSNEYELYEEIGVGVSATVYRALCIPFNEVVAIKVLDLEKCNNDFDGIRREVQTMTLIDHPNVLRAYCSFTSDRSLWVVMPYMSGGSCLHIMKSSYPDGFDELVIATLLREVLKALVYLHNHGHIHRDVKAGNILIDGNGAVKLADFGVSACMFDTGDRQRSRNTFVGTPCWMAPEVMQQLHGYDFKADVWSFGITALELAHGHAPFSKYPPMKVLLMTLQNAPPGLDYERDKRFSKSFKDLVAACLVKDPKKRPTSEKLLKHSFFRQARSNEYLAKTILDGLSPLGDRFRKLKAKEADNLLQNKALYEDKEHLSQQEYIKGISGWNFNLEELKRQAALIDDTGVMSKAEDLVTSHKSCNAFKNASCVPDNSTNMIGHLNLAPAEDDTREFETFEGSFATSFPSRPLEALKGYFDVCDDDTSTSSPEWNDAEESSSDQVSGQQQLSQVENFEKSNSKMSSLHKDNVFPKQRKFYSDSLVAERAPVPSKNISQDLNRDLEKAKHQTRRNSSGPLTYRQMVEGFESFANIPEEAPDGRIVQRKGRFKIMSADAGTKVLPSTNCPNTPTSGATTNATTVASSALPLLQFILQQNANQQEQLTKLTKYVEQPSGRQTEPLDVENGELSESIPASTREKELQSYAVQLQQSIVNLVDEVQKLKAQNSQLQRQLFDLSDKMEDRNP